MSCEVIADGFHVHPNLLRMLLRDKPIDKIVQVTDGLRPVGQNEGPFFANGEEVTFRDGIYHRVSDDAIAGSGSTLIKGIQNLTEVGYTLLDAVKTASFNPAQIMHYTKQGSIVPGNFADITVFDKDFNIHLVMIDGNIVKDSRS